MTLKSQTLPPSRVPAHLVARIDGASRGNPGPASYGAVLESESGAPVTTLSKTLGYATNNVAEYRALLAVLDYAREHHVRQLKVLSDSELLVRQIQGVYKVKSPDLKPLYDQTRQTIAQFESFSIQHVRREQNREADKLANKVLDAAEKNFEF